MTEMFVGESVRVYAALTTWVGAEGTAADVDTMSMFVYDEDANEVYTEVLTYDTTESRWEGQWDTVDASTGTYRIELRAEGPDTDRSVEVRTVRLKSVTGETSDTSYFVRSD